MIPLKKEGAASFSLLQACRWLFYLVIDILGLYIIGFLPKCKWAQQSYKSIFLKKGLQTSLKMPAVGKHSPVTRTALY